ncbi:type VI secretion system-associated protein TagO [Mameliella sp.]|uniref:type VI secretion system-associated protein TagO n=2 Tax=Mameliella sp. TaxID=1924940 RepID=UPI003B502D5B
MPHGCNESYRIGIAYMKFAAFTLLASVVLAQPALADPGGCVPIENDLDRLSCYDKALGRDATVQDLPKENGKWQVQTEKSDFKDTTDVYMTVRSEEPLTCNRFGPSRPATLMVRCLENTTSLIIHTDCHLASGFQGYGKVEYRVDDRPAKSRNFDASTDNSALGLWSGGRSIPLVKEFFGGHSLLVRFTPFSQSPVTAKFDITGLEDSIDELRSSCSW